MAQLEADGTEHEDYICVGERIEFNKTDDRNVRDKYCSCFVNDQLDYHDWNNKKDLIHRMGIIAQALMIIEEDA